MDKLRKQLLPITTFVPIDVKRLFRDKVGIFFVFIFPLVFLFVFGGIFSGDDNVSFKVALLNQSNTEFSSQFEQQLKDNELFDIDQEITNVDQAREKMSRGEVSASIILPETFGLVSEQQGYPTGQAKILYDQGEESAAQALSSVMEAAFKNINSEFVPTPQPFTVTTESTNTEGLERFDYTFSGLLGFTLLSLGIFGPTTVFPRLKQRGVLRRYQSTTIKVWQYFVANVLSNAFVGILAAALMFVVALTVFNLNMRGSYLDMIFIVVLGTAMLFGIGLAIGGWAKNENQAAPLSQLIVLPMMFLSGVFFPTFLMPEWLQAITKYIPLTPVVDAMRLVITESKTLFDLGPQLLIIGAWTVVIYIIAFKVFRWE